MKIVAVTISDRASKGEYEDKSGPALEDWCRKAISSDFEMVRRVIPDGMESVRDTLIDLCDNEKADLILMDMGLPELDGWEVTCRLKANEATPGYAGNCSDRIFPVRGPRKGSRSGL